jgi:hypothetical protein
MLVPSLAEIIRGGQVLFGLDAQEVPVAFGHEVLLQTMNDPDCDPWAVQAGYIGLGLVSEAEIESELELGFGFIDIDVIVVVGGLLGVEVELGVGVGVTTGDGVAVSEGSTSAHIEEMVSTDVPTR